MTNEEALTEARRLEADLAFAIAAGEIPPRPDPTTHGDAWRAWYDAHVRCSTVAHQFMQRERGTKFCKACLARMTDAESAAAVIVGAIPAFQEALTDMQLRAITRAWTIDTIAGELAKLPPEVRERARETWRKTFPEAAKLAEAVSVPVPHLNPKGSSAASVESRTPLRKPRAMP